MKKRIILVGNKLIDKNISDKIEQFDIIVRLNRMNNFGMTGKRTDILLVDANTQFFQLIQSPFQKYRTAKKLWINQPPFNGKILCKLLRYGIFSVQQIKESEKVNTWKYREKSGYFFTNFFILTQMLIEKFKDTYDIWIVGIDINGRGKLLSLDPKWKGGHDTAGMEEERILTELINDKKIHLLEF